MNFKLKPLVAGLVLAGMATGAVAAPDGAMVRGRMYDMRSQINQLQAKLRALKAAPIKSVPVSSLVKRGGPLMSAVISFNNPVGAETAIYEGRMDGTFKDNTVYLAGAFRPNVQFKHEREVIGGATGFDRTYHQTKISYTSALAAIGTLSNWGSSLVQFGVDSSHNLTFDKGFILVGRPHAMPVYLFAGKDTVNFGSFNSYSNFADTKPLTEQYFMATVGQVGIGYLNKPLNTKVVLSFLSGTTNTDSSATVTKTSSRLVLGTNRQISAWAITANHSHKIHKMVLDGGLSYQSASAFRRRMDSSVKADGIWDAFLIANVGPIRSSVEFISTVAATNDVVNASEQFPGTSTASNMASGARVQAWNVKFDYATDLMSKRFVPFFSASELRTTSGASQYLDQVVLGGHWDYLKNVNFGIEYAYKAYRIGTFKRFSSYDVNLITKVAF